MTDDQLWKWINKSITTCKNIYLNYSSYEAASYSDNFYNARQRFDLCAEEFDARGLKSIDFSCYEYNSLYMSDFFIDSMA